MHRVETGREDARQSVPARHLKGGESVLEAVARKAHEACGVEILDPAVTGAIHRRAPDGARLDFFVTVSAWRGEIQTAEPDKCGELRCVASAFRLANVIP